MALDSHSIYLRKLVLRAMRSGRRGHYGSSASLLEILRVIYDIKQPDDKVILSKGHGCLALYALLVDKGVIPVEWLDKFCHADGELGGHPNHETPGIEWSTGALGHGPSIGVGQALAARIKKQNHRIFVICGDGEIQEGSVWEACMAASKHKLNNLVLVIDYNKLQSSGFVEDICPLEPIVDKFKAFGFATYRCDGHDIDRLTVELSQRYSRPLCLIADTRKGKGIAFAENNPNWHYKGALTDEQLDEMDAALGKVILPSRIHEKDIRGKLNIENHDFKPLVLK